MLKERPPSLATTYTPRCVLALGAMMLGAIVAHAQTPPADPWPAPVPGYKPLEPNEHPRLFFRKADLPELKKRAATDEGKAIVARLKATLGGGEAMPTSYSPAKDGVSGFPELPFGTYTIWHAAGFGMLYQLTGEPKYADLGRQCLDKMIVEGVRDIDPRNAWRPTSSIRGGPSIAAVAVAYDLCYDGWPADYRKKIAQQVMAWKQPGEKGSGSDYSSLERIATEPKLGPQSNHFGNNIGGAAITVAAFWGDGGADQEALKKYRAAIDKNLIRAVTEGFGSGGYFNEQPGPGNIAAGQVLVPAYRAMYVAFGQDYITPRPNVRYLALKWALELLPSGKQDGKCYYPNGWPQSGYGTEFFERGGNSHGGHFAQGFGIIPEQDKPAFLWVYKNFVEPGEDKAFPKCLQPGEPSYDVIRYPSRAIFALANWPIGVAAKNPQGILPHAIVDDHNRHYVFRNRWKDADDTVVAITLGSREGKAVPQRCMVWGLGERINFGRLPNTDVMFYQAAADGSGVITCKSGDLIGVDFSKASGADALVVISGPAGTGGKTGKSSKILDVTAGTRKFSILSLSSSGQHPEPKVDGEKVLIGGQTISVENDRMVFAKMAGPQKISQ